MALTFLTMQSDAAQDAQTCKELPASSGNRLQQGFSREATASNNFNVNCCTCMLCARPPPPIPGGRACRAAPFRGAEQANIAIEVVQQLAGGFVEGGDDADAAEAGDGVPDGLVGGHAVCSKRLGCRWLVQRQNVVLDGVQRLDIQPHSILPTHHPLSCPSCSSIFQCTTSRWCLPGSPSSCSRARFIGAWRCLECHKH